MLDNEKTEVVEENEFLDTQDAEKLTFHYDNHVSYSKANLTVRDRLEAIFSKKKVKTAILLLLSLIVLCSSFLPFVTIHDLTVGNGTYSVSLSGVDCIDLSIKSFYSLSDEALMETDLAKEVLSESHHISDSLLKKQVFLTVMSQDVPISFLLVMMGVVSALYIAISAVICIMLLLKLVGLFMSKTQNEGKLIIALQRAESLFGFLLCMIPLMIFCSLQASKGIRLAVFSLAGGNEGLAGGLTVSLIFLTLASVMVYLERLFKMTSLSTWKFNRGMIKYVLSVALMLAVILLVFAPCLTLIADGESLEQKYEIGYDFLNFTEISGSSVDYYMGYSPSIAYDLLIEQVQKSNHTTITQPDSADHMMALLLMSYCRLYVNPLYMVVNLVAMGILFVAGLLLWHILQNAFGKKENGSKINRLRVFLLIGVLLLFVILMLWTLLINLSLIGKTPSLFRLSIEVAPVIMLFCTLGTLFFSYGTKIRKVRKAKKEKRIK